MALLISKYAKGPLTENTYLVKDEATGFCAVIDPGYIGEDIIEEIIDSAGLKYLIITHAHFDHFQAVEEYMGKYPEAEFVAPEKDKVLMFKDWSKDIPAFRRTPNCPEAHIYVSEGYIIRLGESQLRVIETPGHTVGGICLLCDMALFSGDTLFRLSVGNTSFDTGSWDDMVRSISEKLYKLDDDVTVYPGHGNNTSIGYEKRANPFV